MVNKDVYRSTKIEESGVWATGDWLQVEERRLATNSLLSSVVEWSASSATDRPTDHDDH